jgi:hypothetical protein
MAAHPKMTAKPMRSGTRRGRLPAAGVKVKSCSSLLTMPMRAD